MLDWERAVVSTAGYKLTSGDPQVQAVAAFEDTQVLAGRRTQRVQANKVLTRHNLRTLPMYSELARRGMSLGVKNLAQNQGLRQTVLGKRIHGAHAKEVSSDTTDKLATNRWLVDGKLDSTSEAVIVAAQDGVTHTNRYLHEVIGKSETPQCRLCGERKESIGHILSKCSNHHKERHDRVLYLLVKMIILRALGLRVPTVLFYSGGLARTGIYGTTPEVVKVDVPSPTDKTLQHTRPDVVVRLDVTCPWDGRVIKAETEKRQKYQALAADLAVQWDAQVKVVPVALGALGTIKNVRKYLGEVHFLTDQGIPGHCTERSVDQHSTAYQKAHGSLNQLN